ncbi:hypothetical protein Tco_0747983 [Tanacetum coccineum]|uniref:Uncharacterized protein n=1 Tax=Tanacetum coccineum TaxID=301880 RepID=A0ABQ4YX10_9ASTR
MIFKDCLILLNMPYLQKEMRRISGWTSQENAYSHFSIQQLIIVTIKPVPVYQAKNLPLPLELVHVLASGFQHRFIMDNPNITMEEYIRLQEEKALSCGETFDWQTATYGKMEYYENEDDSFMNFKTEYPAIVFDDTSDTTLLSIVYNDGLTSKLDILTEPFISPQHVDEFNMKDETSFSECDEEEQNILYFHDLFPFNVIYADDSKSDKDNENDKIDIKKSLGGNVINTDDGAYAHGFGIQRIKELNVNIVAWNYLNNGMLLNLIKNLYVPFCIPFDPKLFYKDGIKLGQYVFPDTQYGIIESVFPDTQYGVSNPYGYTDATWRIIGFGIQRIDLLYNVFNCFPAGMDIK